MSIHAYMALERDKGLNRILRAMIVLYFSISDLVHIDEVDLEGLANQGSIRLTLVDHNRLAEPVQYLEKVRQKRKEKRRAARD